jgi:hypothetical protein
METRDNIRVYVMLSSVTTALKTSFSEGTMKDG